MSLPRKLAIVIYIYIYIYIYCNNAESKEQAFYKFPGQSIDNVCLLCEFHKLAGMEKDVQDNVQELAIPIENDVEIIIPLVRRHPSAG